LNKIEGSFAHTIHDHQVLQDLGRCYLTTGCPWVRQYPPFSSSFPFLCRHVKRRWRGEF